MNETTSVTTGASSSLDVLLVRDSSEDARLFAEYLEESRLRATLRHEECLTAALSAVQETHPDVLVVDLGLPDREGPATVRAVAREAPSVPIVVLTGEDDLRAALEAQKAGAAEYLKEGELTPGLVERTLRWAVERSEMRAKLRQRDTWIRSITENIAGGVFRVGPTGRIQYANEALARMLGFAEDEELIGRDLTTFYADDTQRGRMVAAEGVDGAEIRFERQDGSELVGLLSAEPAYREGGKVLHYDGVITDITDRKEAEEQLRQREEQLRRINENISEGIYRSAPGEGLVYANQAFAEMFGYDSVEGVLDADPTTLYGDPEEREQLRETLHEQGHFEAVEVEFRRKDGSTFTGLLSGTVVRGEDGAVKFYDGAVTDVSDRVQRERKLRILSEAVDQAKEAVLITEAAPLEEPGPNIAYVNEAFEEMTGYTEEEVLGKTPAVVRSDEHDEAFYEELWDALLSGETCRADFVNERKDGTQYIGAEQISPVLNEKGEVTHFVSIGRDVTEKRRREEELRETKRLLETTLESLNEAVIVVDPSDREIINCNAAVEEIFGYAPDEIIGQSTEVLHVSRDSYRRWEEISEPELEKKGHFLTEYPMRRKDGRVIDTEIVVTPLQSDSWPEGVVSVIRDVTERKTREEELRRQKKLLEQAQRLAGAWEVDLQSGALSWSEEVYRIHEVEPGTEMEVEDRIEFYAPEARPEIREAFERCVDEREPYDLELPLVTAEGNRRWVRTVGAPSETQNGDVVRVAGAIQDITDRKEAEQALKESEELHRATLSNITDAVLLTREDGTFSYVCPNVSYIFGYTEEEVEDLGSISALLGVDPAEEHDFEGTQEISNVEQSVVDASGDRHDLLINVRRVAIQDGRRMYTCRDVTERKKEEKRRKQVIERVTDAIVEVDSEWRFTLVNDQAETLYDMKEEELLGKDFWEVFSGARGTRFEDEYRSVMESREPTRFEEYYPGLDGCFDVQVYPNDDGGVAFYFEEVTERKERERRLEAVFNHTYQFTGLMRPDGTVIEANDTALEFGGVTKDEVLGTPLWDTYWFQMGDDTRQRLRGAVRRAADGEFVRYEVEVQGAEDTRIIDFSIRPVTNEEGKVVLLVPEGRDITERKQKEQELAHQKALLEAQAEATIDGLLAVDENRNVAFYNERFLDIWDVPESIGEQDPIGKPLDYALLDSVNDLLEDPEGFREKVEYLYDHPDEKSRDLVQLSDGRWLDRYSAPIVGDDGTHFGRLWMFRDITERERRERELETLNTRLQLALGSTNTGIFDWDIETDEVIWDETSERLFGYESGGFPGTYQGWADRVHPDDLPDAEADIEQAIETGDEYQTEFRVQLPNGTQRWIEARGVVEYEEDETPVRMIGIHTDVTERREREERLREAKEEAEEASRLKSAMLANMSHEIRTPLTSITGFAEILTNELEGRSAAFSERIYRSGQRLMKTINSVLELSKLEAGAYEIEPEPVRLDRVAEEAVDLLRPQARERNVDLEGSGADQPVEGHWNEGALNRIAENLIENAIKFTPEGGRVSVRVGETEGEAYLEVEDTGVGIGEEALPGIFEAFKQESEGLGREYEGTGLGLSIVRELIDRLGGEIEVESEKGEGTCFTVRLPKAKQNG